MLIPFDELFRKHRIHPEGILHLGASVGQEAEVYHRHLVRKVIWVEAIPEIFEELEKHVANYPENTALKACISDSDGKPVTFNISSNQGQSSSFLEFETHLQAHPNVRNVRSVEMTTIRVDTLLYAHSRDGTVSDFLLGKGWFLNIDLQGAELLALKGMGDLLKKFDYAYIEVNTSELYKGCPMVDEIDNYLAGFGFEGAEVKMTNWGWGDKLYLHKGRS